MAKLLKVINRDQCIGCLSCMFACSKTWNKALTTNKARLSVRVYPDAEGAFSIRICYGCKHPDCADACPTDALIPREGGGVEFNQSECIHCGECIDACVPHALLWDEENKIPLVCFHCGMCASFCPNNVIKLVEVEA